MKYRISVKDKVYKEKFNYYSGCVDGVEIDYAQLNQFQIWCKEHVGQDNWTYYGQYRKIPFEFKFRNGEDLLAFTLRFALSW